VPLDPEVAALLERQRGQPPRSSLDVAATREMMRRGAALAGAPPALRRVEDLLIPGRIRARHYWPDTDAARLLVVYFHGGRFFSGDLESHDPLCRILAATSNCRLVAVDYRLAPEHVFPAAVEDAVASVAWACTQGVPVAVVGDSAGACLAASAALAHRGGNLACQVLIYPMLDATCSSPSYTTFAEGFGPGAADMKRGWALYLPAGTDPEPLLSRDTAGAPPAFVLTAEYDTLRDEGEAYARKLIEDGNLVQVKRYLGAIHGFFTMPGTLRLAREALADVAAFLTRAGRP